MKLSDCRDSYYYNSQKVSDICRNLAFAGLALIWAFKVTETRGMAIPRDLRWAGVFLIGTLALDFLQYATGTIVWGIYHRVMEKRFTSNDKEFLAPKWINYPAIMFFYLKQTTIALAYTLILISMLDSFWK